MQDFMMEMMSTTTFVGLSLAGFLFARKRSLSLNLVAPNLSSFSKSLLSYEKQHNVACEKYYIKKGLTYLGITCAVKAIFLIRPEIKYVQLSEHQINLGKMINPLVFCWQFHLPIYIGLPLGAMANQFSTHKLNPLRQSMD